MTGFDVFYLPEKKNAISTKSMMLQYQFLLNNDIFVSFKIKLIL